jgi:hypothetical protein
LTADIRALSQAIADGLATVIVFFHQTGGRYRAVIEQGNPPACSIL